MFSHSHENYNLIERCGSARTTDGDDILILNRSSAIFLWNWDIHSFIYMRDGLRHIKNVGYESLSVYFFTSRDGKEILCIHVYGYAVKWFIDAILLVVSWNIHKSYHFYAPICRRAREWERRKHIKRIFFLLISHTFFRIIKQEN